MRFCYSRAALPFVEITSPHSCTKVAGIFVNIVNRIKNICFKNSYRNVQPTGIALDYITIFNAVARVHYKKNKLKRKFIVPFQLLKSFAISIESLPPEMQTAILSFGSTSLYSIIAAVNLLQIVLLNFLRMLFSTSVA